jgi:uncharacterized membrane-anchored protein
MNKSLASREASTDGPTENASAAPTKTALEAPATASVFPREHPERYTLTNELHARPFEMLTAPLRASMYATALGEEDGQGVFDHLVELCRRFGVNPPPDAKNQFSADFGPFRLRFERHTEFASYTVYRAGPYETPFEKPASAFLPKEWLDTLPGRVLVAIHLDVLPLEGDPPTDEDLRDLFVPESLVTSTLSGGAAQVWTDLRIHPDGHNRILLKPIDLPPPKAGRVAQRLLEIAAYRNFALLTLPVARSVGPQLSEIDKNLADVTDRMSRAEDANDADLLDRLTRLSAEIERLNSQHSYRFSAGRAYYALVKSRLAELREERHSGYQTIAEFLDRRLTPAMRTCQSVEERMANLSRRATRAADLLRTRVDFLLEKQNNAVLKSMDRRAKMQLRLQQTVEGLSVAAITYYAVGLIGYGAEALSAAGVVLNPGAIQGIAVPIVALSVWWATKRVRRHLEKDD